MDFERSTQARSWIFDEQSLADCRKAAVKGDLVTSRTNTRESLAKPRKHASGFHRRRISSGNNDNLSLSVHDMNNGRCSPVVHPRRLSQSTLSVGDQEALVRFHAHQISSLVGPEAILPELRSSRAALSTAIMLFRRFFLSNSVAEFCPRQLSVGAAFLGGKLEESKIEIGIVSHATAIVQLKFHHDPLFSSALCRVSISEIEAAEKLLMEGVNYELRCHHPHNAIRVLVSDFSTFLSDASEQDGCCGSSSPITSRPCPDDLIVDLHEEAMVIAQAALVVTDAAFLFPPGQIAFAAVSMAVGDTDSQGILGRDMHNYLRGRFAKRLPEDLVQFERRVSEIISYLQSGFDEFSGLDTNCCNEAASIRARELRRIIRKVSSFRLCSTQPQQKQPTRMSADYVHRKRRRPECSWLTSPCDEHYVSYKIPRVTPTKL